MLYDKVNIPSGIPNGPEKWRVYAEDTTTTPPESAFIRDGQFFTTGPWLALIETNEGIRRVGFVSNNTDATIDNHLLSSYVLLDFPFSSYAPNAGIYSD